MKKNIIKKAGKVFIALLIVLIFQSCDKWLDIRPESEINEDQLFSTEQGYMDALYGVYVNMSKSDLYGGKLSVVLDVIGQTFDMQDDAYTYQNFKKYNYQSDVCSEVTDIVWERLYYCIMLSNNIIKHLDNANKEDFEYYDYIRGESLALRAYLHYEILKIFAPNIKDNPNYMSIPYKKLYSNDIEPQKTVKEIFNLIIKDLLEAKELLDNDVIKTSTPEFVEFIGNDNDGVDHYESSFLLDRKFRMNYYAVIGTLSRVYLDNGDKENAYLYAKEIIDSEKFRFIRKDDFSPNTSLDIGRDLIFNDELIFGLFSIHIDLFAESAYIESSSTENRVAISKSKFSKFYDKLGDIRILLYLESNTHENGQQLLIRHSTGSKLSMDKFRMLTLHEICMIAAECKPTESIELIDKMAKSREFSSGLTSTSTTHNIMKFIAEEYRREYVGEGHFWHMFKRNKDELFMQELQTGIGINDKQLVLPLPAAEIEHGNRVSEIWNN